MCTYIISLAFLGTVIQHRAMLERKGQLKATAANTHSQEPGNEAPVAEGDLGRSQTNPFCTSCTTKSSKLFSHLGEHQGPLEGPFKHTLRGCTPKCLIPQVWNGTPKLAFLMSSQVMLRLLVWSPDFENHRSKLWTGNSQQLKVKL